MARKRQGSVLESTSTLRALEKEYAGAPEETRVAMLKLLKQNPDRTIEEVATTLDCSPRTIKRWWKIYQEGGLHELVGSSSGNGHSTRPPDGLDEVRQLLADGEIGSLGELREWLDNRETEASASKANATLPAESLPALIPASAVRFDILFRLTTRVTELETISEKAIAMRDAIMELFDDVDRATVSVNGNCEILNPEKFRPGMFILENVAAVDPATAIGVARKGDTNESRLLSNLQSIKFPVQKYHPNRNFEYYYQGRAYLGMIMLWSERQHAPVSDTTIEAMRWLEPFWIFLMSGIVMNHKLRNPIGHDFGRSTSKLIAQFGLTEQEQRVLMALLLGFSQKDMAERLSLTVHTIKHHLKSIYAKTGTMNHQELFARFFTPRGVSDSATDK